MSKIVNLRSFVLLSILMAAIFSCKKDVKEEPAPPPDPTLVPVVYTVGYENNGTVDVAMLWKNGVGQPLTDGSKFARAQSVYVAGNDVYIAGYNGNTAMLWKNGTAQPLGDGTSSSKAYSVYVFGSDIYVAGEMVSPTGGYFAMLWKNGVATKLSDGTKWAVANSVFVTSSGVYVAGRDKEMAMLWKDGFTRPLRNGSPRSTANSVYVSGSEIYVALEEYAKPAMLWKDGTIQQLALGPQTSIPYSVCIAENIIYIAGYDGNSGALWKNGIVQLFKTATYTKAYSVFVNNGDVFLAGQEQTGTKIVATFWKNGVAQSLTTGQNAASALGIFVK